MVALLTALSYIDSLLSSCIIDSFFGLAIKTPKLVIIWVSKSFASNLIEAKESFARKSANLLQTKTIDSVFEGASTFALISVFTPYEVENKSSSSTIFEDYFGRLIASVLFSSIRSL